MILIDLKDFAQGDYRYQFNDYNESYYIDHISVLEKLWIKVILGEKLGSEFISDPSEVRWNKIKDPFILHNRKCFGLKYTLVAFIYSDLVKSDGVYSPQSAQKVKAETNISVDIQANYSRGYNDGVTNAELIRHKLRMHHDLFEYAHHHYHHYRLDKSYPF